MIKKVITLFTVATMLFSCGRGEESLNDYNDGFNRASLLQNIADNIILPSYNNLNQKLEALEVSTNNFTNFANQNNLEQLRLDWLNAYLSWQNVEMFDIGMAEEIDFRRKMNAYPCNVTRISLNISSEDYDLNSSNHYSAQGFPTLDYLLNGFTDPIQVYNGPESSKHLNYLNNLVQDMLTNTNNIINEWNSNREPFINSTENTATSSLNKLTNDFIFYYEKGFRANKIGIPAGVFSGSPLPQNIEAYYHNLSNNNTSKNLALEAFTAINKFFSGVHFNNLTEGSSLKEYLDYLNATEDGDTLSNVIISTFNTAAVAINDLDDDLMNQINTDNNQLLVTYDKIQAAVPLLKVDMIGNLSIDIDYIDADGD